MATGVLLSIDTELTWRAHAGGASWRENIARSFECAGVGIAYQLETLARHRLDAVFFVDPLPALVFGIEPVRHMVAPILAAGQEVQLHIHPMWLKADRRRADDTDFEMAGQPFAEQRAMIERARELLIEAGAPSPSAFRAGSFGADETTLNALADAGLRYDSSHNGSMMPWPCATGLAARQVAPLATHGLIELPVGLIDEGGGRLRHLQIGAVAVAEIRAALLHAEREGNPLVTVVSHSFELATRNGLRVNRIVRRRFEQLCGWLGQHADRFPTRRIAALGDLPLDRVATPGPAGRTVRYARIAAQGLSNLVYERRI